MLRVLQGAALVAKELAALRAEAAPRVGRGVRAPVRWERAADEPLKHEWAAAEAARANAKAASSTGDSGPSSSSAGGSSMSGSPSAGDSDASHSALSASARRRCKAAARGGSILPCSPRMDVKADLRWHPPVPN